MSPIWASIGLAIFIVILAGRQSLCAVTVVGTSMEPTLTSGDLVVALRYWPRRWLRRGNIVLIRGLGGVDGSSSSLMIKRLGHLPGDQVAWLPRISEESLGRSSVDRAQTLSPDEVFVLSDNSVGGIDSRVWGPIPLAAIAGIVLLRVPPPKPPS